MWLAEGNMLHPAPLFQQANHVSFLVGVVSTVAKECGRNVDEFLFIAPFFLLDKSVPEETLTLGRQEVEGQERIH
jgi:hypothetical protein